MSDKDVFVFIGTYGSVDDAQQDYAAVKELHSSGVIGTYDAAVVAKDADGKVHVHKDEKPTQHGAWTGIAVGAVVGILFPPSIIASAAAGGVALDAGQAALVVVGRVKLSEKIEKATAHALKKTEKQMNVDGKDFEKELAAESKAAK